MLERVLDKGIVIAGDIVVNVLDIELLTLKLRLFISSADTADGPGLVEPRSVLLRSAAGGLRRRTAGAARACRRELEELFRPRRGPRPAAMTATRPQDDDQRWLRTQDRAVMSEHKSSTGSPGTPPPEVLATALDRARAQAVDRLAALLTDAIVAQALTGAPAPAPTSTPAPVPEPRNRTIDEVQEGALRLRHPRGPTARCPTKVPRPLTDDARLKRVGLPVDLALLVSRVHTDELRIDEDDLSESGRLATLARGHDAVVRAAAGVGPVLPLRFGTVVADEAAARRLLAEHGDSAHAHLRRIGNTREWGVKLVRRLEGEPAAVGSRPGDRAGVSGTEYLTRRRRVLERHDAAEADAEKAADLLQESLRPHVAEALRRGGAPGSSLLLDLAFLVSPDSEADFLAAAGELREHLAPEGLELEVSQPWPPYSFAALTRARGRRRCVSSPASSAATPAAPASWSCWTAWCTAARTSAAT